MGLFYSKAYLFVKGRNMSLVTASSTNYDLRSMDQVIGYYIYDIMEKDVAAIRDLLVDKDTKKPHYAVIEIGGIMSIQGKKLLIPWNALRRGGMSRLDIDVPEEQILAAPAPFEQLNPTREEEESIHRFFNVEPYWYVDVEENAENLNITQSEVIRTDPIDRNVEKLELENNEQEE